MVTTFNDRLIHLTKTVAPIVGKPSALLHRDPLKRNMNTTSTGTKRKAPTFARPLHAFPLSARRTSADDAKRRRVKDELNYTAATIKQALEDAGRPPKSVLACRVRALPHSVNTDSCMVISSAAYDASNADADDSTTASADDTNDTQDEKNGVDDMLLYSSLIQSTSHYYGLGNSSSLENPTESNNNDNVDGRRETDDGDDDDDDDEELRASSDATSTWAPSSNCNNVNLNDKKTIDNDNRSDGMSSNPASSTSGEEETSDLSISDQCEGEEASPSPTVPEKENRSDDNFLDNINMFRGDDLNSVEIQNDNAAEDNDDAAEDIDDNRKVFFVVG